VRYEDFFMQATARAVIVGGGIAGASIAYHLARLGWRDVLVLEQGELVSGTTSHAPGLVGQLRSDVSLAKMLMYSVALYRQLRVDGTPGYIGEGSLRVASSPQRFAQLQQQAALARSIGLDAHLVSPQEAGRLFPLMNLDGIEGALHLPDDGSAVASILAQALIREAQTQGVTFSAHTKVTGVDVVNGAVRRVQTSAGAVETETLIVAAGIWSPLVGRMAGVALALTPMQHQYVVTDPLPELAVRTVPNLRDPDKLFYLRQREQSLVIGGYERSARPFDVEAIPERPDPTVQSFEATQFAPLRRGAAERVPAVASVGFARQVNGLEAFTPDGLFLLGPAPNVRGFWTACGFCAHGVSGAGGVGKVLAEWIVNGDPGLDVAHMTPARFGDRPPDATRIKEGAARVYGTYYDIIT
jgi:4-methylaminobutanoate oxidase (formaldehyde-forming)